MVIAAGYVLEADSDIWHKDHTLQLIDEVQYIRKEEQEVEKGRKEA